jgi:hypothetical protein
MYIFIVDIVSNVVKMNEGHQVVHISIDKLIYHILKKHCSRCCSFISTFNVQQGIVVGTGMGCIALILL